MLKVKMLSMSVVAPSAGNNDEAKLKQLHFAAPGS